jgi:hypothetical protein
MELRISNIAMIIIICISITGCGHKSVPAQSLPSEAKSYPCKYTDEQRIVSEYHGSLPLVPVDGSPLANGDHRVARGWRTLVTKRVEYFAIVEWPNIDRENPPKIWVCFRSQISGLYCGGPRPYIENGKMDESCERVRKVRYNGMQMRISCGQYEISGYDKTQSEVFAEAMVM